MPEPTQGQTLLEHLFLAVLLAAGLPILVWGVFALKPGKKIKIGTVIMASVIELLIFAFISFTLGDFLRGLFCMLGVGIPFFFLFYLQTLYMYRVVFPRRDQFISDFVRYLERKQSEPRAKNDK